MKKVLFPLLLIGLLLCPVQGEITYTLKNVPANKEAAIRNAMDDAMKQYNKYADYTLNVTVKYSASVKTANASYKGPITFGGSISKKTAIHEMGHVMGIGVISAWNKNRDGNTWTGHYGSATLQAFDGKVLKADKWHFWPYGFNYHYEDAMKHVVLIGAMRQDMGLSNKTYPEYNPLLQTVDLESGMYTITNKAVIRGVRTQLKSLGTSVVGHSTASTLTQAPALWELVPVNSFFYLDNVGARKNRLPHRLLANSSANTLALVDPGTTGDWAQWQLIPNDDHYYLDNIGARKAGVESRLYAKGTLLHRVGSDDTSDLVQWAIAPIDTTPVLDPPPDDVFAALHESTAITLNAAIVGDAAPILYQWYRGESSVISQRIQAANAASLPFPAVSDTDFGAYWCRIWNALDPTQFIDSPTVYLVEKMLLAHWPLDAMEGLPDANDVTNNGYAGIVGLPAHITVGADGTPTGAWLQDFNEPNYISIPQVISTKPDHFSICGWIKTQATGANGLFALARTEGRSQSALWLEIDNGRVQYRDWDQAAQKGSTITGATVDLNNDSWHHVCVTHNRGKVQLYVNGHLDSEGTTTTALAQPFSSMRIGARVLDSDNAFTGALDDLRFYAYPLYPEEIEALHLDFAGDPNE